MNPFTKIYQNLSDKELLKIMAESHKFEPLAIQAAQEEFNQRDLSDEEIMLIEDQLSQKREKKNLFTKKSNKLKNEFNIIGDAIAPIQKQPTRADSQVIVISVLSFLIAISSLSLIHI